MPDRHARLLRFPPDLDRKLVALARYNDLSVNKLVTLLLAREVDTILRDHKGSRTIQEEPSQHGRTEDPD